MRAETQQGRVEDDKTVTHGLHILKNIIIADQRAF